MREFFVHAGGGGDMREVPVHAEARRGILVCHCSAYTSENHFRANLLRVLVGAKVQSAIAVASDGNRG